MSREKSPSFVAGLLFILASVSVFSVAFFSEQNSLTGLVVANQKTIEPSPVLKQYNDVSSLAELSPGKYYINSNGIVYYMDDKSRFAVASVSHLDDSQKDRFVYIDTNGNIGYLIDQ